MKKFFFSMEEKFFSFLVVNALAGAFGCYKLIVSTAPVWVKCVFGGLALFYFFAYLGWGCIVNPWRKKDILT